MMARFFVASLLTVAAASAAHATPANETCLLQIATRPKKSSQRLPLNQTETDFISGLIRQFGKQSPTYEGAQKLRGFGSEGLLDAAGMFNFDSSIKSVAIDVGAASNPLSFDLEVDSTQVVLGFEPIFVDQLGKDMETVAHDLLERGGCTTRWEGHCGNERMVIFPSAMSSEVGHATFHLAANPYCGSLNSLPDGGLDPSLVNSTDKEIRDVMASCWGSISKEAEKTLTVPTVTMASILRRIPEDVRVKYVKIDAQGQDFKILMSAGEEMKKIEYVRFEMQVDPPPGRKMVQDIPSYAEVEKTLTGLGFVHEDPACNFDDGSSAFSKAIEEKECIFCRELPCKEGGMEPMGERPQDLVEKEGGW